MALFDNPFIQADRNALMNQPQQGNQGGQQGPQNKPGSGMIPGEGDQDNKDDKNKKDGEGHDPLLQFDKLWQPNVDDKGQPIQQDNEPTSYLPAIDPQKFAAMVDKMDFTRTITPEDWQAVTAGGEGAARAFGNVINKALRQAFSTSFAATTKFVEGGFNTAKDRFMNGIPKTVRELMTDDALYQSNPIMKNPAFAPLVKNVRDQYIQKWPKASPGEINAAVTAYFDEMLKQQTDAKNKNNNDTSGGKNTDKLRSGDADADFTEWLGKELSGLNSQQDQSTQ